MNLAAITSAQTSVVAAGTTNQSYGLRLQSSALGGSVFVEQLVLLAGGASRGGQGIIAAEPGRIYVDQPIHIVHSVEDQQVGSNYYAPTHLNGRPYNAGFFQNTRGWDASTNGLRISGAASPAVACQGVLQEVALYDYVLTTQQVARHHRIARGEFGPDRTRIRTTLDWEQLAPQGATGPTGPTGYVGPPGPPGEADDFTALTWDEFDQLADPDPDTLWILQEG
jgi:hypothetical protein